MITRFRLADFKGHRDTALALERFTVLVGDTGSGKTSVLEALRLQSTIAPDPIAVLRGNLVLEDLHRRGATGSITLASTGVQWESELTAQRDSDGWLVTVSGKTREREFHAVAHVVDRGGGGALQATEWEWVHSSMKTARLYRFESDKIAESVYSDLPDTPIAPIKTDGARTAVALAALKLGDNGAFDRIEAAMRKLVPSLQRIRIKPAEVARPSRGDPVIGSKLFFDFHGSLSIPAHHASQGTLILVALLAVLHGHDRPDVILLDDIERTLHPRVQMKLVRMIKELLELDDCKETQIVATTHSPYVLDELSPENVIAFALRDDGTVASKPLSAHPDAAKMRETLKTGQLWSLDAERDWVLE